MESILIHPNNKEQLAAAKAFAKTLKMSFETKEVESPYKPEFVKKLLRGRVKVKNGKGVSIAVDDLWK